MRWRNVKLEGIQSPLSPILPEVQYAAERAVPLGRPAYDRIVRRQQIGLRMRSTPGRINDVGVDQHHEIAFSLRALEHLWGLFFAHVVVCDQIKAAKGALNFEASVHAKQAKDSLEWSNGPLAHSWPDGLPSPSSPGLLIEAVNRAYLWGCGFILLHEIGHVVLGHANTPVINPDKKIRREYAADDWAAAAIIQGGYPADRPNQLMAIAMVMGVIGGIEIGEPGVRRHPLPTDRLLHFYGNHVVPNCPDAAILAGVIHALVAPVQAHVVTRGHAPLPMDGPVRQFLDAAKAHYI